MNETIHRTNKGRIAATRKDCRRRLNLHHRPQRIRCIHGLAKSAAVGAGHDREPGESCEPHGSMHPFIA